MNYRYPSTNIIALFIAAATLSACQQRTVITNTVSNSTCESISTGSEPAYCSTVSSYGSPITITGTAKYQRRVITGGGYLGAVDATTYPIRYAELEVIDNSTGGIVQCGETDSSGNFSFQLPNNSHTHTVVVYSRGFNSTVKASVMDRKEHNQLYSISTSFVANGSKSVGTITAAATGSLEGGAFNIFDLIVKSNEFLATNTAGCSAFNANCTPYTAANKVNAFWKPGFNPACYFGSTSGLSFYMTGTGQLYILGGRNGDVDNSDTDHFDDSVVVHEYGHFIEDKYAKTDSPGGSHSANYIVDPRLAWGEGWANFFALAVTNNPVYTDTYGNSSGSTFGSYFNHNLRTNSPQRDPDNRASYYVSPFARFNGEGNFREFAITRALFGAIDSSATLYSGYVGSLSVFKEFWTIFAGSNGFPNSSFHFRNFGLFMQLHSALAGHTTLTNIYNYEYQKNDQSDYATPLAQSGASCPSSVTITPRSMNGKVEDGSIANSNQHASNDFYSFYHGGGPLTVTINRTSGTSVLDLYVYREGYVYGNSDNVELYGSGTASTQTASGSPAAGYYMINVMADTSGGIGSSTNYTLNVNTGGVNKCP